MDTVWNDTEFRRNSLEECNANIPAECVCDFCDEYSWLFEGQMIDEDEVRYYKYDPRNVDTVFETFRLVETSRLNLKTVPVGGLVDFLLPIGHLKNPTRFEVYWHLQEGGRTDPRKYVNIEKWGRWFDFAGPKDISFENCAGRLENADSEDMNDWDFNVPDIRIPEAFFDLPAIRNAQSVNQGSWCKVDMSYQQLTSLKAPVIIFYMPFNSLSPENILEFFKGKVEEWISAPSTKLYFSIESKKKCTNTARANFDKLLADVTEQLRSPDFRVYPHYSLRFPNYEHECEQSMTIRSMKSGLSLHFTPGCLSTIAPKEEKVENFAWPEKHGLF